MLSYKNGFGAKFLINYNFPGAAGLLSLLKESLNIFQPLAVFFQSTKYFPLSVILLFLSNDCQIPSSVT